MALLAACGGRTTGRAVTAAGPRAPDPVMVAVPDAGWDAWVAAFKGRAAGKGISQATLSSSFARAGFLPEVIEKEPN